MIREIYSQIDLSVFAEDNYGPNREIHKAIDNLLVQAERQALIDYVEMRLNERAKDRNGVNYGK